MKKSNLIKTILVVLVLGLLVGVGGHFVFRDKKTNDETPVAVDDSGNKEENIPGGDHSSPSINVDDKGNAGAKDEDGNDVPVYVVDNENGSHNYIAEDKRGSSSTVTVPDKPVDDEPSTPSTPVVLRDSKAPVITASDITVPYAVKPTFDSITATDDKDGEVKVAIVGDYDVRKAGIYPLSAVAKDAAGNTASVKFSLIVQAHPKQNDLDEANKKVQEALAALNSANGDLEKAQEAYDKAKEAYDALVKENGDLKKNLSSLEEAKKQAEAVVLSAREKLSKATDTYNKAVAALEGADVARQALADAKARLERAESNYEDICKRLVDQKAAYSAAQTKLGETKDTLAGLKSDRQKLVNSRNNAVADVEAAEKALKDAEAVLNAKKKAYDAASAAYDAAYLKATESEEFRKASENVDKANLAIIAAVDNQNKAKQDVANAQEELKKAMSAKTAQDAVVKEKKSAMDDSAKALEEANKAVVDAQKALADGNADKAEKKALLDEAQKKKDAAQQAKDKAQKDYNDAIAVQSDAAERLKQAKAAVTTATANADAVAAKYNEGSLGFFKVHDDNTRAEDTINTALSNQKNNKGYGGDTITDDQKTVLGASYDATSLDNMLATFTYIRKSNELRAKHDAQALLVTDYMMAVAQIKTNASAAIVDHTHWYGTGENLVFDNVDEDPFIYWYDIEKEVYDYKQAHPEATDEDIAKALDYPLGFIQTGHFTNLIKPGYEITGFAINTNEDIQYPYTYGQEFSYIYGDAGTTYTVDQYEKDFLAYYNDLHSQLVNTKKDLDDAKAYLAELEKNGGLTDEEMKAITDSKAVLDAKEKELSAAITKLNTAKDEFDKVSAECVQLEKDLADTQTNADIALANNQTATTDYNNAVTKQGELGLDVLEKSEAVDDAKDELAGYEADEKAAREDLATNQAILDGLNQDVVDARNDKEAAASEVDNAQDVVDDAGEAVEDAKDVVDGIDADIADVDSDIENAEKAVADATTVVENEEKKVDELEEDKKEAEVESADAGKAVEDAQAVIDALEKDVKDAEDAVKEASDAVDSAEEELAGVNSDIKTTETAIVTNETDTKAAEGVMKDEDKNVEEKQEAADDAQDALDDVTKERDAIQKEIDEYQP